MASSNKVIYTLFSGVSRVRYRGAGASFSPSFPEAEGRQREGRGERSCRVLGVLQALQARPEDWRALQNVTDSLAKNAGEQ